MELILRCQPGQNLPMRILAGRTSVTFARNLLKVNKSGFHVCGVLEQLCLLEELGYT
jgi:hypothetical protein